MSAAPEGLEALPLEKILETLARTVERLEKGDLPLDQLLGLFEEGVKLAREGQRRLDSAEARIETLLQGDGPEGPARTEPLAR
jgi:exodeoxyribonuclease VII small subunit